MLAQEASKQEEVGLVESLSHEAIVHPGTAFQDEDLMWRASALRTGQFDRPRRLSTVGFLMFEILFLGGFITIGGEWFAMWQSKTWNGLDPAFRNAMIAAVALVLIHLQAREPSVTSGAEGESVR